MEDSDSLLLHTILTDYAQLGRTGLLPALQAAQKEFGFLSEPVVEEISRVLGVPLADAYGAVEFYSLLRTQPVEGDILHVCDGPVCALEVDLSRLASLQPAGLEPSKTEPSPCLGLCNHAPAALLDEKPLSYSINGELQEINGRMDHIGGTISILTANCRGSEATSLDKHRASGGYTGLHKAFEMGPERVIAEVKAAGLQGRGGAAFPTSIKWEGAARAPGDQKYVVCNADESEPGTFKDRILMEKDPHAILEGIIIAAFSIGASQGYYYIRSEYPKAFDSVRQSLLEAREAGLIGQNILGTNFHFEIELRQGAGAYICGEETALLESIEGKRGYPRIKPPFPTTHGLFGKPTVINNVETLANIPYLMRAGAANYRSIGTAGSPGPKLFCVSGDVLRPGLYEVPFGIPLRELLYDLAGGIRNEKRLAAVLIGGAAGIFAGEEDLDVPLSFEGLQAAGLSLGSGAIMVFDETRDLRDILSRVAGFFAHESCGKCYPCQIGTLRQHEILQRVASGSALPGDDRRLADVGWTMTDASLCGLGQTAAAAVLSALRRWPELLSPNYRTRTPQV